MTPPDGNTATGPTTGASPEDTVNPATEALRDSVVVITGASRGIGEALARGFSAAGARLVLSGRTVADLDRVAADCPGSVVVPCDVRDEAQVQALVDRAIDTFGRIDTFIVNAAVGPAVSGKRLTDLTSYDLATWQTILDTNFTGVWLCLKAAIPRMAPGSNIILIGSGTGRTRSAGNSVYAISKAGTDALTLIAAGEGGRRGIRVNCLSPGGMTDTHLFGPNKMPDFLKKMGYLEPDVIIPAARWIASDPTISGAFVSAKHYNADPEGVTEAARSGRLKPWAGDIAG